MGRSITAWPPEREQDLAARWTRGDTLQEIAIAMAATRGSISSKVDRMRLHRAVKNKPGRKADPSRAAGKVSRPPSCEHVGTGNRFPGTRPVPTLQIIDERARITIAGLTNRVCHWPVGDPAEPGFGFCGLEAFPGPYCAAHAAIAYKPVGYRLTDKPQSNRGNRDERRHVQGDQRVQVENAD